ncbi:MAG: hypothetical protein M3P24_07180, partial [Gemmatimonadota bacterium]|nr:hypothetical protein [Gemmatimonadota bacterium]
MSPGSTIGTAELAARLAPLLSGEIASIGALDTALRHEDDPGYVVLYLDAKTEKQASVQQMLTLLRTAGEAPGQGGGLAEPFLKLQILLLQKVDTTLALRAMRRVEAGLVEGYRAQAEALDGVPGRALAKT